MKGSGTHEGGISVSKSLQTGQSRSATVEITIESEYERPAVVNLTESVPTGVTIEGFDGRGWLPSNERYVTFTDVVLPAEPITTGYKLTGSDVDSEGVDLPTIASVQSVQLAGRLREPEAMTRTDNLIAEAIGGESSKRNGETVADESMTDGTAASSPAESYAATRTANGKSASERTGGPIPRTAVGIIVQRETLSEAIERVTKAVDRGYEPFITYAGQLSPAEIEFVERIGANLVSPPESQRTPEAFERKLSATAKAHGFQEFVMCDSGSLDMPPLADAVGFDEMSVRDGAKTASQSVLHRTVAAIPAYNEEDTIVDVVTAAKEYVDEVIVVDDGSSDGTAEKAEIAGATVVRHRTNQGYGSTLKTMFREVARRDADRLVTLDADGQHDPADIPALIGAQKRTGAELVIGSRFLKDSECNAPFYRRVGLRIVNTMTNLSLGVLRNESWVTDTQSGFRAYDRKAIESLAADGTIGDGMSASTNIIYHAHRQEYRIAEVGVSIDYDVENASSHNPVAHGITLVGNILRTVEGKRPLTVLGLPGCVGTFVGFGFAYWTLSVYISTHQFPIGLSITSVFFTFVGILTCFTAIILHSLNTHLKEEPRPER